MTYHWAYEEDGDVQVVEKLPNGKFMVFGISEAVTLDGLFVSVDDEPIPQPPRQNWTADMLASNPPCEDCPPPDYPTDKTRCADCPRRLHPY